MEKLYFQERYTEQESKMVWAKPCLKLISGLNRHFMSHYLATLWNKTIIYLAALTFSSYVTCIQRWCLGPPYPGRTFPDHH
jgi:hypothetical protein